MTRRKDGLWQEVLTINGKKKYFYGKKKADVLKKIQDFKEKQEAGALFEAVAADWWEEHSATLKEGSIVTYKPALDRAIDEFKNVPINEMTPLSINTFIESFADQGYAEKTTKNQLMVFKLIFKYAVKKGFCNYNIAKDLSVPNGLKKTDRDPPPQEEIDAALSSFDVPFGMFAYWILFTGLRRGELLALTWDDVDLKNRSISITKSVRHATNRPTVTTPKSKNSISVLPIVDRLYDKLVPSKGLIFPNSEGRHMSRGQFDAAWEKYQKITGIKSTPHQFRHAFATMLFEQDIPAEKMQILLRHAQLSTTMETYRKIREKKIKDIHKEVLSVDYV